MSLDPDVGGARHRRPFLILADKERAELLRRQRSAADAELGEGCSRARRNSSPAFIASLSRRTISGGVPAGAASAVNEVETKSGRPLSIMVGRSGVCGLRASPVVASPLSLPSWMSWTRTEGFSKVSCTWPAMMSVSAAAVPLYGTWTMSMRGALLEHLADHVRRRAVARRGEVDLAGVGLGMGDQFGDRMHRQLRVGDQQVGAGREQRDRREFLIGS